MRRLLDALLSRLDEIAGRIRRPDPREAAARRAVKEARQALRQAEQAHRRRLKERRRLLSGAEREHARALRGAAQEVRAAETLDEQAYRQARGALARSGEREQLARYEALILYDDGLVTPDGAVGLSPEIRARIDTAANLAQARRATLARLGVEGAPGGRFVKELRRHPDRLYLLIEAPGFATLVRCRPEDAGAREFAERVNIAALNAETFARRREEAIALAQAEVAEIERRRATAAEHARTRLAEIEDDTKAIEMARTALAEVEADTAEVEHCRAELGRKRAELERLEASRSPPENG